ncbi:hypothetical protein ABIF86_003623 [Bradyrhizobium japonicum]
MMALMKVRAIYPIFPLIGVKSDAIVRNYRELIQYGSTPKEIIVRGDTSVAGKKLLFVVKKFTKAHEKHLTRRGGWKNRWVIEFSGSFSFPGVKDFNFTDHTGKIIPTPASELRATWADFLPSELDVTIQTYLLALTIAFPGALRLSDNIWWLGRKKQTHSKFYKSAVQESLEFLYSEGFKPRENLTPTDVIDWIFKSNGIFNGLSDTPASRSLNFFNRLFSEQYSVDELSELVWAVAGIEAVLVEGGRSSVGQLREKLLAIFQGRVEEAWLNKRITEVYNYRSRMIHGDRQIKSAFRTHEDAEINSRFYEEYHSALFAVGILIELLQEMIFRKLSKFQFATIVRT